MCAHLEVLVDLVGYRLTRAVKCRDEYVTTGTLEGPSYHIAYCLAKNFYRWLENDIKGVPVGNLQVMNDSYTKREAQLYEHYIFTKCQVNFKFKSFFFFEIVKANFAT